MSFPILTRLHFPLLKCVLYHLLKENYILLLVKINNWEECWIEPLGLLYLPYAQSIYFYVVLADDKMANISKDVHKFIAQNLHQ